MRFGKTFATYQLARKMGWRRVLVLTFKPAVATAWHDDLVSHVDFDGWRYVDKNTLDDEREEAADYAGPVVWLPAAGPRRARCRRGRSRFATRSSTSSIGDAIVLDEYHFGAWRDSARALYDPVDATIAEAEEPDDQVTTAEIDEELAVHADHYLYLSGTLFRAITEGEFTEDAIFNWTYIDEQREKANWGDPDQPNPYLSLPQMQMYTYDMGVGAAEYAEDGEFGGFSLNETFKATG